MAGEPDIEGVLAAIDDLGSCLAAQDLAGTLALLADDADVIVIPSEGVEVHRGRAAVESFFRRIYGAPRRYSWRWRDRWVSAEGAVTGTLVRRDGWHFLLLHGSEALPVT